ncbi:MAG: helix-turn-helix domain-containing protein, partial [Eubacterium sp.]|nr:helix-turn-helix domain-containing protein [Eubacterium sp.]
MNRSHSTVSREFARNSREDGTYSANYADKQYAERRKNCGRKPILKDETAKKYVIEKLEQRWSPEQIARCAKLEKQPFSISYPTIYRA